MGGLRHALAALPPGTTRYALYRGLGGPQGRFGWMRRVSPLNGIASPDRLDHSSVAILTELSRLTLVTVCEYLWTYKMGLVNNKWLCKGSGEDSNTVWCQFVFVQLYRKRLLWLTFLHFVWSGKKKKHIKGIVYYYRPLVYGILDIDYLLHVTRRPISRR